MHNKGKAIVIAAALMLMGVFFYFRPSSDGKRQPVAASGQQKKSPERFGEAAPQATAESVPIGPNRVMPSTEAMPPDASRSNSVIDNARAGRRAGAEKSLSSDRSFYLNRLNEVLGLSDRQQRLDELLLLGKVAGENYKNLAKELISLIKGLDDQNEFVKGVISVLMEKDPVEATTWAAGLAESNMAAANVEIAKIWAATSPDDTVAWANGIPNPAIRQMTLEQIAATWAEHDLNGVYDWAAQLGDPKVQTRVFAKMGMTLAQQDPRVAADWSLNFVETSAKYAIMSEAFNVWVISDPKAAVDWIEQLPDEAERQRATDTMIKSWVQDNPYQAVGWAGGIADPQQRNRALGEIARNWAAINEVEAAKWAESVTDRSLRQSLMEIIEEVVLMKTI